MQHTASLVGLPVLLFFTPFAPGSPDSVFSLFYFILHSLLARQPVFDLSFRSGPFRFVDFLLRLVFFAYQFWTFYLQRVVHFNFPPAKSVDWYVNWMREEKPTTLFPRNANLRENKRKSWLFMSFSPSGVRYSDYNSKLQHPHRWKAG